MRFPIKLSPQFSFNVNAGYLLFVCLFLLTFGAFAQSHKYEVHIIDNASVYNNRIEYYVTEDSLVITGLSDFGRTPVRYLKRELNRKESKSIRNFLNTFPIDSLDDLYNNEFNPADYSEKGDYPRIMELTLINGKRSHYYKTVNCWVRYSDLIFNVINPLVPTEVRINYNKANFNAFY